MCDIIILGSEGTGTGHRRGQRGCKHTSSGGKPKLVYYCDSSPFYGTLARALNRKVSPHNRSLYKSVTVEVLSLLVSRDIILCNEERLRTQWETKGSWHADRVKEQNYVRGKTFSLEGGCTRDIAGNSGQPLTNLHPLVKKQFVERECSRIRRRADKPSATSDGVAAR